MLFGERHATIIESVFEIELVFDWPKCSTKRFDVLQQPVSIRAFHGNLRIGVHAVIRMNMSCFTILFRCIQGLRS